MKKMLGEFREFALRGNVLDLAVGVIIGGAFSKIVSSLVSDIFMPLLGFLIGGLNFSDIVIPLPAAGGEPVVIGIGLFIQAVIDFLFIALAVFLFVKFVNRIHKKPAVKPEIKQPPREEQLLEEIRDLLKAANK